jgi:hypothetical protein
MAFLGRALGWMIGIGVLILVGVIAASSSGIVKNENLAFGVNLLMRFAGVPVATNNASNSLTWRQKMAVTVNTPRGPATGSAVSEGFIKKLDKFEGWPAGTQISARLTKGEATVVDLGDGKYLFALLPLDDARWYLPFYTFLPEFTPGYTGVHANRNFPTYFEAAQEFVTIKGPHPIPEAKRPRLVMFKELANPASVVEILPGTISDELGEGYSLASITLEITDESVTDGRVQALLPWLGDPRVMENRSVMNTLPIVARDSISGLLTDYSEQRYKRK